MMTGSQNNFQITDQGKSISIPAEIGDRYYMFGVLLLNDDTGNKVSSIASKKTGNPKAINQLEIMQ